MAENDSGYTINSQNIVKNSKTHNRIDIDCEFFVNLFVILQAEIKWLRHGIPKDIIVADKLGVVKTDSEKEYLAHLLCLGGTCRYRFNERDFELHAGDLSIIRKRKMVEKVEPSDDFRCKIIYATPGFIELCTPQSNYGMKGSLALFLNPVIHLTPEQQIVCRRDFDLLELRIRNKEHRFYQETLINAMQAAILDFFDFHATLYGQSDISTQNASIMNRF